MKSIIEEKYPVITGELQTYNEKFIEGANYVLEQIEEMLALKNQYTNKCDFCDDLEWRIEQLKK